MDAFGIENLRCLSDTGLIKLKPLTILVGQNSSGKSTFLRALPLLRQSVESRTTGPILWYGRLVDFGSFHEAIRSGAEQKEIVLKFQFSICEKITHWLSPSFFDLHDQISVSLILKVMEDLKQGMTRTKECILSFAGHNIRIVFDNEEKVTTFKINELDVLKLAENQIFYGKFKYLIPYIEIYDSKNEAEQTEIKSLGEIIHLYSFSEISPISIINLAVGSSQAMLANTRKNLNSTEALKSWTINSEAFKTFRNLVIAYQLQDLL